MSNEFCKSIISTTKIHTRNSIRLPFAYGERERERVLYRIQNIIFPERFWSACSRPQFQLCSSFLFFLFLHLSLSLLLAPACIRWVIVSSFYSCKVYRTIRCIVFVCVLYSRLQISHATPNSCFFLPRHRHNVSEQSTMALALLFILIMNWDKTHTHTHKPKRARSARVK